MTATAIGVGLGYSDSTVAKWISRGMPRTSVEDAKTWLEDNRKPRGRPPGYKQSSGPANKAAAAIAHRNGHGRILPGPTPREIMDRLIKIERMAFADVEAARESGSPIIERETLKIYTMASAAVIAARDKIAEAQLREDSLLAREWVWDQFKRHDASIMTLLESMPRSVAARLGVEDVEAAEAVLWDWVQNVAVRCLTDTFPFDERGRVRRHVRSHISSAPGQDDPTPVESSA